MSKIEVTVTTVDDRDEMFAELFYNNVQFGEVTLSRDGGSAILKIYPPLDGSEYVFEVAEFRGAVDDAVDRLRRVTGADSPGATR